MTALIHGSVVGMFEMPFVPNVEFAQQGLDHGGLRFESQCSVLLMMAFPRSGGNCQSFWPAHELRRVQKALDFATVQLVGSVPEAPLFGWGTDPRNKA